LATPSHRADRRVSTPETSLQQTASPVLDLAVVPHVSVSRVPFTTTRRGRVGLIGASGASLGPEWCTRRTGRGLIGASPAPCRCRCSRSNSRTDSRYWLALPLGSMLISPASRSRCNASISPRRDSPVSAASVTRVCFTTWAGAVMEWWAKMSRTSRSTARNFRLRPSVIASWIIA